MKVNKKTFHERVQKVTLYRMFQKENTFRSFIHWIVKIGLNCLQKVTEAVRQ